MAANCNWFRLLERQGRPCVDIDTVNGDGLLSAQGAAFVRRPIDLITI